LPADWRRGRRRRGRGADRPATGGKGADVVFDLVGGVMFRNAVNSLALRGRLVEIAATGQREVSFDLADFYHNESRLSWEMGEGPTTPLTMLVTPKSIMEVRISSSARRRTSLANATRSMPLGELRLSSITRSAEVGFHHRLGLKF
jgi:threonine dehydrogenase-like Zn-dependent dehydrogenase